MENPFTLLERRLSQIEQLLSAMASETQEANEPTSDLLTVDETADLLHLSKPTIYSKCSRRELPFMKRGKRIYFSREELVQYLKDGRQKTMDEIQADAAGNLIKKKGGQRNG
jgi:excisionase family DNA binding protein